MGQRELPRESIQELLLRQVTELDEGFAQTLAGLPLPDQSPLELIPCDQPLTDHDLAERFAWPAVLPTHHRAIFPPYDRASHK